VDSAAEAAVSVGADPEVVVSVVVAEEAFSSGISALPTKSWKLGHSYTTWKMRCYAPSQFPQKFPISTRPSTFKTSP